MEKLISLQPDLVLAESIHEKTVLPALEKLGLSVFVTSETSIDTVLRGITVIGQMNGKTTTAKQLVNSLSGKIKAISAKTDALPKDKRFRVLYVVWHQPDMDHGVRHLRRRPDPYSRGSQYLLRRFR
jgi:iron complex transport system substrate-binding protein